MTREDFVYLNVYGLLNRYENPSSTWRTTVLSWTGIVLQLLRERGLLKEDSSLWHSPVEEAKVRFSDLTEVGQRFVMSQAIEAWLRAFDREAARSPKATPSKEKLEKRFKKFMESEKRNC